MIETRLTLADVRKALHRQFGFLAKSNGTPLWLHSFTVWSIASKFAALVPRFSDRERLLLEIAALFHDIGKRDPVVQEVLSGKREGKAPHRVSRDEIRSEVLAAFEGRISLSDPEIDSLYDIGLHHSLSGSDVEKAKTPAFGAYSQLIRWADRLASMAADERPDFSLILEIRNATQGVFEISFATMGRFPSPTTFTVLQIIAEEYGKAGWTTLLSLENAVLFVGKAQSRIPDKASVVGKVRKALFEKNLQGQSIKASFGKEILSGEARKDPRSFLTEKKVELLDFLGDVKSAPIVFFRLLMDLYKHSSKLTKARRKSKVIDILAKAGGPAVVTKAFSEGSEWCLIPGINTIPGLISAIFQKAKLSDILDEASEKPLSGLSSDELFQILDSLAGKWFPQVTSGKSVDSLDSLVGMEEETDFSELAMKSLDSYAEYKDSRNPKYGICEQCGGTTPLEAKPALNFPQGRTGGFTQVNPKPSSDAPKVVCPLCVFDATQSRHMVSARGKVVIARISSPIPDLWALYPGLRKQISSLSQALQNAQEIRQFHEIPEFEGWPLPGGLLIPIPDPSRERSLEIIQETERGVLFVLETPFKAEGTKNLRARFLALYSLLNGMGFVTHIGTENQTGLFGERPQNFPRTGLLDRYRYGLSINLFSRILREKGKTANVAAFSRNLLETAPSQLFSVISDMAESRRLKKFLDSTIVPLVKNLCETNLVILDGKEVRIIMKELLKDASFFAGHLEKFCVVPRNSKGGVSKYAITKPVDAVLNGILQGLDFEEAFARFLPNIRMTIPRNLPEKDQEKRVDEEDLAQFISGAKEIFRRYSRVRSSDIGGFIRLKNGIRSAIHMLQRYKKLQEVVSHD